jgi:hypothetical protein
MSDFIEWGALGQVLVVGLLVGAGIPALFALGLRLLAGTTTGAGATEPGPAVAGDQADADRTGPVAIARPTPARLAGAVVCLGVVVGAIALGLVFLVSGGH